MSKRFFLLLLCMALPALASAGSVNIDASFRPDPAKPFENKFRNDTPNRALCAAHPAYCASLNIHSLFMPVTFSAKEPIRAGHSQRNGPMIKLPGWSDLQVTHSQTGATDVLRVRIKGIGATYYTFRSVEDLTGIGGSWGHARLWGSTWLTAPPCTGVSYLSGVGHNWANFFWIFPNDETMCSKQANFDLDQGFVINYANTGNVIFAYELETPNPLKMEAGLYTGQVTYTVGPGQQIDFGDVMLPSDSTFQIVFTLTVEHTLKVEIPPGGNRIQLEPQGGWQAWLNQGRKPARLFRDQTFNLSASSRFKMQLECGTGQIGDTCAVKNAAGDLVPLDVLVSLPNGMTNTDGAAVNRLPLRVSGTGSELFQPSFYVDRRPATLHFEVQREGVEEMLKREGETWSGSVSVIWDSEV
ncbi:hypothetical protein BFW88_22425 [Pseudomonas fluorescens]|uniref:Uncharacterized protein n=1 Tax=Pseudomonas lactucae TaxID=2813360 RepID=A0A9X0YF64_9PSED|nr:hypothetical protein [Pseudomonas lactucae]OPA85933.1 hypothetical protein BFW88_22425 [Pseudomonas fluorescens]MBN2979008.1 hypothetical protein [Pseudomonas lactucae]MBN2989087.1 hypothetical protein [Pseudomonas lactucae]OPB06181.1 hypothetical protein BFW92_22375 [Pseudomonas fluorescens]OPB17620.1 hypothetical protein BFW93_22395 [Pseudomonas fluorescens]